MPFRFKSLIIVSLTGLLLSSCQHKIPTLENKFFTYRKTTYNNQTVHIVSADLIRAKLKLLHSQKSKDFNFWLKKAPVVINGGFFDRSGSSVESLRSNKNWLSKPGKKFRGVIAWNEDSFHFDRLRTNNGKIESKFGEGKWWEDYNVLGGAPLLVHNGGGIPWQEERLASSFLKRHARSAICLDKESQIHFVMVEEGWWFNFKHHGFTIKELQEYMISLGCQYALNLDGGSSAALGINKKRVSSLGRYGRRISVPNVLVLSRRE